MQIAEGCRRPLGRFKPVLPAPSGGMKLHRVQEMRNTFGDDSLFLIGGALLEAGPDLEEDARMFARSAGRDIPHQRAISMFELHEQREESKMAPYHENSSGSSNFVSIADVERVSTAVSSSQHYYIH